MCESKFVGADGTRGVICGPHRSFTAAQKRSGAQYVMNVYNNFFRGTPIIPSVSLLSWALASSIIHISESLATNNYGIYFH